MQYISISRLSNAQFCANGLQICSEAVFQPLYEFAHENPATLTAAEIDTVAQNWDVIKSTHELFLQTLQEV